MPCGGVTALACIGYSECAWDTLCSSDFEMEPHSVRLLVCLGERIEADVQGCGELFAILFDRNDFDVAAVESCSNGRHDFRSKGIKRKKKNFYYCVGSFRKSHTVLLLYAYGRPWPRENRKFKYSPPALNIKNVATWPFQCPWLPATRRDFHAPHSVNVQRQFFQCVAKCFSIAIEREKLFKRIAV